MRSDECLTKSPFHVLQHKYGRLQGTTPELPMFLHLFKDRRELQPLARSRVPLFLAGASVYLRGKKHAINRSRARDWRGRVVYGVFPPLKTSPDGEGTRDCHLPPLRVFISVRLPQERACISSTQTVW